MQRWLAVSESGNGLPGMGLLRRGARCSHRLRRGALSSGLGGWSNEELTNVALGPLDFISCFCFGLSNGRRDDVDPGRLFVGFQF